MDETHRALKQRIESALKNDKVNQSRKKALHSIRKKNLTLMQEIPFDQIKNKFREIKRKSLEQLTELLQLASKRLEENGCKVYYADTAEDVYRFLNELIDDPLIVKCKTNTAKELNLTDYFKSRNIEVVETDLGDRIVQLSRTHPSHPLIPSLHIPKAEAAKLFNIEKNPAELTVADIVEVARKGIRELILKANIGLSGANAITAEEGFICLEENEGNQRLITSLPRKHIVLAGIDKIVPSAEDALHIMKTAALALAQRSGTYLSFISGPSKTADIDFELTYGMHGPAEVHVIFIDNGRRKIIESGYAELLYCANCGACANACPVYEQIGDEFGNGTYICGRGLLYLAQSDLNSTFLNGLNFCTGCLACEIVCPGSIDIHHLLLKTRALAVQQNLSLPPHQQVADSITNTSNPFQESTSKRANWLPNDSHLQKTKTLLFVGCMASFRVSDQAKAAFELLEFLGIPFTYLGTEEPCCGSVLRNCGLDEAFKTTLERCQDKIKDFSEIITICPGCYSTFQTVYADFLQKNNIKVRHLIELLPDYAENFAISDQRVTYHDPCHLGRQFELYEPPRLLFKKLGLNFQEMEYTKENANCCGAGAGVLSAFPELASKIAESRIDEALDTGAEILLTACPFCAFNLSLHPKGIQIRSIQEFLLKNKKAER